MIKCLNETARDVWGNFGPRPGEQVEIIGVNDTLPISVDPLLDTTPPLWYFRRVGDRGEVFTGYPHMFDDVL